VALEEEEEEGEFAHLLPLSVLGAATRPALSVLEIPIYGEMHDA